MVVNCVDNARAILCPTRRETGGPPMAVDEDEGFGFGNKQFSQLNIENFVQKVEIFWKLFSVSKEFIDIWTVVC